MGSGNEAKLLDILTKWKTTRRRLRRRPKGAALRAAPLGFVVFHLVRISYVFASFPEPILGRFGFFHLFFSGKGFSTFLALSASSLWDFPLRSLFCNPTFRRRQLDPWNKTPGKENSLNQQIWSKIEPGNGPKT